MSDPRPLIAHVIHHFGTGGMENGMVMLFNHLPEGKYRHAVINLAGYGEFRHRIRRDDIGFYDLAKRAGRDVSWYGRLARLLRELRPAVLHTRNLSALEAQFVGAWAGVPGRVHGEHGRDVYDLHGKNLKYNLLRRLARPCIHRYIAVSRDLEQWLRRDLGVRADKVRQIYNGVDGARFHPRTAARPDLGRPDFFAGASCVIGTVGRLAAVKDYPALVRAFALLRQRHADPAGLRLVLVGDGPQRHEVEAAIRVAGLGEREVWLPGDRKDIADWLRAFDVFCLTSLGEGVSNTILEAMACGVPVAATAVGGTPELVCAGENGSLVPPGDAEALAAVLNDYATDPERRRREGAAARARIERDFVIERMAAQYAQVYDELIQR